MNTYPYVPLNKSWGVKRVTIAASDLNRTPGSILKRVAVHSERLVVERDGYPVAAVVPYPDYETLTRLSAQKDLMAFFDSVPSTAKSKEEVEADVLRAVHDVRHGKHKKR